MTTHDAAPPGYVRVRAPNGWLLALRSAAESVREAVSDGETLYEYAARHPRAIPLAGRGIVYAVPLPGGHPHVVVRHSRRGGWVSPLLGDRFVVRTRVRRELAAALRLTAAGVPTPEVVAIAEYGAGPLLRRSDVATREIPRARDLSAALIAADSENGRRTLLEATATLLTRLAAAGARHPDLNAKNVLLSFRPREGILAHVLDVDRVVFGSTNSPRIAEANVARLVRSLRKRRRLDGVPVEEEDLRWLADKARVMSDA